MIPWAAALVFALLPVPRLTGPVVDQAGVLSAADERRLDEVARRALASEGGTGPQMAFLVVRSLEGEPIEDFSIRVAEAWQLGTAEKDNGLLFVVAVDDRQVRVEVGNGIEGEITDAQASRMIREILAPAFREGRYGDGLYAAALQSLQFLGVDAAGLPPAPRARAERRGRLPIPFLLFLVIFFFGRMFGGRRRRTFWIGPGMGGFGGFGGAGGGFRGGGGGFSGGGASGRW